MSDKQMKVGDWRTWPNSGTSHCIKKLYPHPSWPTGVGYFCGLGGEEPPEVVGSNRCQTCLQGIEKEKRTNSAYAACQKANVENCCIASGCDPYCNVYRGYLPKKETPNDD